ncbi:hypothetical protein ROTO_06610 [Roseovarius tolerans]|uniref:TIGR00255 family protein n=1 Tax=Roseovarius tolerans TaxID=74031 RepID=A0A0L6CYL8_9RHOB|nr:YicC/YloC family endoribonuclease [Roseovarius tolerans]KNX42811.1 hypothetical protein ROTO_06610 [Roseovarius tolerans]
MIHSMTAFATRQGRHADHAWAWELRGVNGKGLDLRLRVPDWIEGLEAGLRTRLTSALGRGNVTVSLRVQGAAEGATVGLDSAAFDAVLAAMAEVEARAMAQGLTLAPANAADVLALRGVLETAPPDPDTAALGQAILADFEPVLESFVAMRADEGAALGSVLAGHLDEIARLTEAAADLLATRQEDIARQHRAALARVSEAAPETDPARIAQELAMLAVKLDVTEEIDRLRAHVAAARTLLAEGGPIGRKLDFLAQEFNREANTLCSKAQHTGLTEIGLALKTAIDQMREQVQNVE